VATSYYKKVSTPLTDKLNIKHSLPRLSAVLLVFMLLAVIFSVIVLLSSTMTENHHFQALKGKIDFSDVDFSQSASIPIAGHWGFYWNRLLSPSEIVEQKYDADYISVSHDWSNGTLDGQALPSQGYATYHVKVKLPHTIPQLALNIPVIGTAYVLYVDEEIHASGGNVSINANESVAGYNPQTILINPKSDTFTLTLKVSNHQYFWGGVWTPLRLGAVDVIYQDQLQRLIRYLFLLAIFLTVAMFNLTQFSLRPSDPLPFVIAVSCILLALRELGASHLFHLAGAASWTFDTTERINFLTFYASIPVMVAYFHLSFIREYSKKIMSLIYGISGGFCLLVVLTPPAIFSATVHWYQGFVLLLMPYMVWGLVQAVRNRRHGARLLILSILFIFILMLNDILYALGIIGTTSLISFGLVALILCLNYLTYNRFIHAGRENEVLSGALQQSNKELLAFSNTLEQQISQRTSELELANRKLEEIASHDSLTGLINRRGLAIFIEQMIQQHRREGSPFCLSIIDLDHFKQVNDNYGHDAGDLVLLEVAKLMKLIIRSQDTVVRWGGEEFLILLPRTTLKGAEETANKLRTAIKNKMFDGLPLRITATFGIAQFTDKESFEVCLKRADQALYEGKENGRDRVEIAP